MRCCTTLPASEVAIGPATGTATGFSLSVADSGLAVAAPDTVQVRLNGTAITPAVSKTGGTTTISYSDPSKPFPPGTTNTVTVSLRQTNGQQVGPVDRTYVVPEPPIGVGQVKWTFQTGGVVSSSPAIGTDGTVYVMSNGGMVYALDGASGRPTWRFQTGGGYWSSPAIGTDGTVYVGSSDGKVYAFEGSAGLAGSPWPKFRGNAQNTGRLGSAPVVLRQPSRVVLKEGAPGQIAVRIAGAPLPSLQWFFSGQPIPGATQATLTIPSVIPADEGTYTVVASNSVGQATSQPIAALVSNVDDLRCDRLDHLANVDGPDPAGQPVSVLRPREPGRPRSRVPNHSRALNRSSNLPPGRAGADVVSVPLVSDNSRRFSL